MPWSLADMFGRHEPGLLLLAALICLLATYTTLSLLIRACGATRSRYPWLTAAAVVVGCGAWATHLVAFLAFRPGVALTFEVWAALLAGLVAITGSGLGLYVARSSDRMPLGGALVGFSLAGMQFLTIAAISAPAQVHVDIRYLAASIVLGASCGAAALMRGRLSANLWGRLLGALMLSIGICGMHLVAAAGLSFTPDQRLTVPLDGSTPIWFATAVTAVILLIVGLGLVGALIDQHLTEAEGAKRKLEETAAKLEAALKKAEVGSESKSRFLATMSHELRTPLNAIIGFSEIITSETFGPIGGDARYREYIADIGHSGAHLLRLVNDILDLSKFDAGRLELRDQDVNLQDVITSCVHAMGPQAEKARVNISENASDTAPRLRADELRVRQILLNLLSNAIKFTPEGGLVSVALTDRDDGLALSVTDTGIGMSAEEIPQALERFGQIDNSLGRKYEGTGLGLPITKHLVELHGGSLSIESTPNAGTVVTVTFPWDRVVGGRRGMGDLDLSMTFAAKEPERRRAL